MASKQRVCTRCNKGKPEKDFYDRKNRSWCRVCTRRYVLDWRAKNAEKNSAHRLVAWALKWGKLKKPNKCSTCSKSGTVVAHHEDYTKPLVVKWVCDSCHVKRHHQIKRERILL